MLVLYLNGNAMVAIIVCGLIIAVSALYRSSEGRILVRKETCVIVNELYPEYLLDLGPRRILPAQHAGCNSRPMEGMDFSLEWPQHDPRGLQ